MLEEVEEDSAKESSCQESVCKALSKAGNQLFYMFATSDVVRASATHGKVFAISY